jgi:hypothetical protein
MKTIVKKITVACLLISIVSACAEPRYYRMHHEHSPQYVQRHHIQVDIHN